MNASVSANNSTLSVSENEINVSPSVDLRTTGLVSVTPKIEAGIPGISGVEIGNPVGGYGGALDLGVNFKSNFGLEAMLSVTDLGAISWINSKYAIAQGDFTYNGIKMELDGNTIKTDIDEIMDRLSNSFTINTGTAAPSLELMPFNVAAGVRYYMPFYEGLSVGALATYHYAKYSSWFDARAGATITPGRFLSFSGNIGYSSFGTVWGTGLNLCLGPINLLVGLDSHIGKMGKIYGIPVPIDRFVDNVHLGLTITF